MTEKTKLTTIAKVQTLRGPGTHVHYRPDGKLNLKHPERDAAIIHHVSTPDDVVQALRLLRKQYLTATSPEEHAAIYAACVRLEALNA